MVEICIHCIQKNITEGGRRPSHQVEENWIIHGIGPNYIESGPGDDYACGFEKIHSCVMNGRDGQSAFISDRFIYTIILHKSVCRCSQTAGRNSCSIVWGNVANCL